MTDLAGYFASPSAPVSPVTVTGLLGSVPLTVRGVSDDSQNILRILKGSDGSALVTIGSAGAATFQSGAFGGNLTTSASFAAGGLGAFTANAVMGTTTQALGNVGLLVRGVASQSADLIKGQNSVPADVFRIDANGNVVGNAFYLNSVGLTLFGSNSGTELLMTRETSQSSTPSANTGKIYFRAGTVNGVKLVAIGPNGLETMIADNL